MIINYDRNCSFIVLATVIMIVNYDRKTFIVQATGAVHFDWKTLKQNAQDRPKRIKKRLVGQLLLTDWHSTDRQLKDWLLTDWHLTNRLLTNTLLVNWLQINQLSLMIEQLACRPVNLSTVKLSMWVANLSLSLVTVELLEFNVNISLFFIYYRNMLLPMLPPGVINWQLSFP